MGRNEVRSYPQEGKSCGCKEGRKTVPCMRETTLRRQISIMFGSEDQRSWILCLYKQRNLEPKALKVSWLSTSQMEKVSDSGFPPLKRQHPMVRLHFYGSLHKIWGKQDGDLFIRISEPVGELLWEQRRRQVSFCSPALPHKHKATCGKQHCIGTCYLNC